MMMRWDTNEPGASPGACPACAAPLLITRLQCPGCGTEVSGAFASDRVVNLPEPHASLLELFLRVRGNVKEMERELGLSYPTVRARLEAALGAARARLEPPAGRRGRPRSPADAEGEPAAGPARRPERPGAGRDQRRGGRHGACASNSKGAAT